MPRMRDDLARRHRKAIELGMQVQPSNSCAWFPGNTACIGLRTLTVYLGTEVHGPFTTVEEAVNMLILLGGGI